MHPVKRSTGTGCLDVVRLPGPLYNRRHAPASSLPQTTAMNDFCPQCSTYLAQASECPVCGYTRQLPGPGAVEVVGSYEFVGDVQPGFVAIDGHLIIPLIVQEGSEGQRFGRLLALDLERLVEVWRHDFPDDLLNPPLLVSGKRVVCATQTADPLYMAASLHSFDAAAGEQVWAWEPDMRALSAPTLHEDALWLLGDGNTIWKVTGEGEAAQVPLEIAAPRHILPPAFGAGLCFIPTRGPQVLAVDVKEPRLRWTYDHGGPVWAGTPLVLGERLAVPYTDGSVALLDAADGRLLWRTEEDGRHLPPLCSDGERLFAGGSHGLSALALDTGAEIWHLPSERKVTAEPLLHLGNLIVAGHDHTVYGLDPASGAEHWRWQGDRRFEWGPIAARRGLVLIDGGGTLHILAAPEPSRSLEQVLAEGNWREAASQLARSGKMAEAATLLEAHDDCYVAAEMWAAAGEPQRAVVLYERTESARGWEKAAAIHEQAGDWVLRAEALKQLAELEDDAESWERARQAYQEVGMNREAVASWREVCRLRRYPFLRIQVQPEAGFVRGQYNVLQLVVRNEGWGVAAALSARAHSDAFSGKDMQSQMMGNLAPGRDRILRLGLLPELAGQVPLSLEVSFLLGLRGEPHSVTRREFVRVASAEADRQSSQALAQQLTGGFDVITHADFHETSPQTQAERLQKRLELLNDRLSRLELERAEQGALAGVMAKIEMDRLIEQTEAEIKEVEGEIDALHTAET